DETVWVHGEDRRTDASRKGTVQEPVSPSDKRRNAVISLETDGRDRCKRCEPFGLRDPENLAVLACRDSIRISVRASYQMRKASEGGLERCDHPRRRHPKHRVVGGAIKASVARLNETSRSVREIRDRRNRPTLRHPKDRATSKSAA